MSDGNGLILEVRPSGTKYWIVRYWERSKERHKSLGPYSEVSLKAARERNINLRRALKSGRPDDTEAFASIAEEWFGKRIEPSISTKHIKTIRFRLASYVLPAIGASRLSEITSSTVLNLCRKI